MIFIGASWIKSRVTQPASRNLAVFANLKNCVGVCATKFVQKMQAKIISKFEFAESRI